MNRYLHLSTIIAATSAIGYDLPSESLKRETEVVGKSNQTEEQRLQNKGLKQWTEYGNVWAATRKAAIKKFNKLKKQQ